MLFHHFFTALFNNQQANWDFPLRKEPDTFIVEHNNWFLVALPGRLDLPWLDHRWATQDCLCPECVFVGYALEPVIHYFENWLHYITTCITIVPDFLVFALPFWIFIVVTAAPATAIAVATVYHIRSN
ncbi:hypothetical protein CEK25_002412 [Fusarium fujikuroi]|nr:hypothetical protein CEK25_002412 [Fusarium fujikuroi]